MHFLNSSILHPPHHPLASPFTSMSHAIDLQDLSLAERTQCPPNTDTLLQEKQKIVLRQRNTPLDLPEILLLIFQLLDYRSVFACLAVSRTWHSAFLTLIWPTLHIDMDSHKCPSIAVLHAHAPLIRTISVGNDTCRSNEGLFCPYLSTLTISQPQEPTIEALAFIRRHRESLTFLSIDAFTTDDLFDAIADCQNLEQLQLHNIRLSRPNQWKIFSGTLWPRLKSITVEGSWRLSSTNNEKIPVLSSKITSDIAAATEERPQQEVEAVDTMSKIQELVINNRVVPSSEILQNQLQLIRQCPDLTHLSWCAKYNLTDYSGPMHLLAETMRSDHHWKRLESLKTPWQQFHAEDFLTVMEEINRLTELDIRGSNINLDTWGRMKLLTPHHWNTIRVLNMRHSLRMMSKGSVVQDIMCSMPSLIIFECLIPFGDFEIRNDNRPWVCLGVKDLTLGLSLRDQKWQSMVMARIAGLVHLERFFCPSPEGGHRGHTPRLTLNKGLDQLKSLKMKEFGFWTTFQTDVWGKAEAQWVLKNWPDLKILQGIRLNTRAKYLLRHLIQT